MVTNERIAIPNYQRPYKWTTKNIEVLLTDICKAIEESQKYDNTYKYRIGTVLIHDKDGVWNIVDGQQRLISIVLICIYLISDFQSSILKHAFSDSTSKENISKNYAFIRQWFTLKGEEEKKHFVNALKNFIEVVVITVKEESEAFQLFDSQNSRGKPLYPHDLLKAYHLREMQLNLFEMEHAVEKWEDIEPDEIRNMFNDYIYPIYNWSQKNKTDVFDDKSIEVFKGADINQSYTYANRAFKSSPIFQICEPFIAGRDFFEYVGHYIQMLRDIENELQKNKELSAIKEILNDNANELKYCKTLFYCAILSYYDRFHSFDRMAIYRLFTWAYMIRIDMHNLGYDTINKYAIGENNYNRYSNNEPIFSNIANARKHTDISNLTIIVKPNENDKNHYKVLFKRLKELNGLN